MAKQKELDSDIEITSKDAAKQRWREQKDAAYAEEAQAMKQWNDLHEKAKSQKPEDIEAFNTYDREVGGKNGIVQRRRDAVSKADGDYHNFMEDDGQINKANSEQDKGDKANSQTDNSDSNGSGSNGSGSGFKFSDTFYRELGAAASDRKGGNLFDQQAETARNQARIAANTAADNEKQAQRAEQAAGRNINAVADERAVAAQQSQDKQRINKAKTTGANAALLRSEVASDPVAAQAEKVEQQKIANERQDKADERKRDAAAYDGEANQDEIWSRDFDKDFDKSARLARGEPGQETQEQEPAQEPAPAPEPEPEQPAQQQEPINYNAQKVINGVLNGTNGSQLQGDDKRMYDWLVQNKGLKSFTPTSKDSNNWEAEFVKAQGAGANDIMQMLRSKRSPDSAATNFNRGTKAYNEMLQRQGQIPDEQAQAQAQNQNQNPPAYAEGTDYAEPGTALVGEEGPELVIDNDSNDTDIVGEEGPELVQMEGGERVVPNEDLKKLLSRWLIEDYDTEEGPSEKLQKIILRNTDLFDYGSLGLDVDNDFNVISPVLKSIILKSKDAKRYKVKKLLKELTSLLDEEDF